MTLPLRDRLFGDTGLPLTGATVQAMLVTGGGTDVGTSSVIAASTTTDVNGMWKFAALADAGVGNWYDVKITNGQQIRWRYGNVQAVLSSLFLQTVFASTHFTSPVIDSGGLTAAGAIVGTGTGGFGVWTAFVPTMSQVGAVTVTVNSARYAVVGKTAYVSMLLTTTSGGTGGNGVAVAGLPGAVAPQLTNALAMIGNFTYSRGGTFYTGTVNAASSTTLGFLCSVGGATNVFGVTPNITVTAGDIIGIQAVYEIA